MEVYAGYSDADGKSGQDAAESSATLKAKHKKFIQTDKRRIQKICISLSLLQTMAKSNRKRMNIGMNTVFSPLSMA
jgi:hypothetical protein